MSFLISAGWLSSFFKPICFTHARVNILILQDPYASVCTIKAYVGQEPFGGSQIECMKTEHADQTILSQCMVEQKYVRGAMLRSLIYNQVSVSGQALVLVVRNQAYSLAQRAGNLTYIAFVLAQIGSTVISIFGFGGYVPPRNRLEDCQFCSYSDHTPIKFFPSKVVPIEGTESRYTASVLGCL